jgi:prepilin-type N-terminal cleavage/methylation domain-containing protein
MKKKAFTLVEIMVVVAIIGLLAAVGIPNFIKSRKGADDGIKEINVSMVEGAKEQWAIMNNKAPGFGVVWTNIEDYVGGGVDAQSDLDVGGDSITLNPVGTKASYPE